MRTGQITIDEELVKQVDRAVEKLETTRSAFTRMALKDALEELRVAELERRHREGYSRSPVEAGEFSDWEDEQ
ncbi:MAG: ribbon-helix-helix domain-containing protein, partial [Thermoanaerobaculia bacterium]